MRYHIKNEQYKVYGKGILFNNGLALNELAAFIFRNCIKCSSREEIADLIMKEYDIQDRNEVLSDVNNCLDDMIEQELLVEEQ